MLAQEPPGSPLRVYSTPRYVLGPDGLPVQNPRWDPSQAAAAEAAAAASAPAPSPPGHAARPTARP